MDPPWPKIESLQQYTQDTTSSEFGAENKSLPEAVAGCGNPY